ncbi:MAG: VCBS repeat-containing protein [Sandaracinaceae bacterium]|nr:VCBS repeat-containing protein [Sandaracinaceae bacterium]
MVHVRGALVVALLLVGCAAPPTQVVVRLATDLAVPGELDAIHLEVVDGDGVVVREQDVRDLDPALADGRYHELATFGLVPRGGDSGRRFEVRATALSGATTLFTTRARSSFVDERTIRLDLYLPGLCIDLAATCQPDETCGISGCVDPEIDPSTLPSNEERPPTDPVDPRPPVTPPPPPGDEAIRPLRPLLGERVSSLTPTLEVQMAADVVGVVLQYCDDPACASFTEIAGRDARVPLDATRRVHYWRAIGDRGAETVTSSIWWFVSRAVDRSSDTTCGMLFDQNGDAIPDLLVGAPGTGTTGAAYVFQGANGAPNTWTSVELTPPPGVERFGSSIGSGDFDGDGRMEIVVGAPTTFDGGRAVVYDAETPGAPVTALEDGSGAIVARFGENVAGVGDVNGDGYHDFAISGADATGQLIVEIWLGTPHGLEVGVVTRPIVAGTLTIAGGGDVDADGYDDFLVGTPDAMTGGWAYIVRGSADVASLHLEDVVPTGSPVAASGFGTAIALGDFGGDGRCDAMISAPEDSAGRLYRFIDGALLEQQPTSGLMTGDRLGLTLTLADLDDDGLDDLLASRQPIRTQMFIVHLPGSALLMPVPPLTSLGWTMPDGTGVPRLAVLGDTGGASLGSEIAAAEIGFGVSVLTDGLQLGDLVAPAGAVEIGAGLR